MSSTVGEARRPAWQWLRDLGVSPELESEDVARVRVLNFLAVSALVLSFVSLLISGDATEPRYLLHTALTTLGLVTVLVLHYRGRRLGAALFFQATLLLSTLFGVYSSSLDFGSFVFLIVVASVPFLTFPRQARAAVLVSGLATVACLAAIVYGGDLDGDIARRVATYGPIVFVHHVALAAVAVVIGWETRTLDALASSELETELAKSDTIIRSVFPDEIIPRLRAGEDMIAERRGDATVLFCEISSPARGPVWSREHLDRLHEVFSRIDRLCEEHGVNKIKTSGSIFLAASGLTQPREDHAEAAVALARALQVELAETSDLEVAIGINSGPVVSGVIGGSRPTFDIWGDTVNTAQRVASHGECGEVNVSALTFAKINHRFECSSRGAIEVKGKGSLKTYVVNDIRGHE